MSFPSYEVKRITAEDMGITVSIAYAPITSDVLCQYYWPVTRQISTYNENYDNDEYISAVFRVKPSDLSIEDRLFDRWYRNKGVRYF